MPVLHHFRLKNSSMVTHATGSNSISTTVRMHFLILTFIADLTPPKYT